MFLVGDMLDRDRGASWSGREHGCSGLSAHRRDHGRGEQGRGEPPLGHVRRMAASWDVRQSVAVQAIDPSY